MLVTLLYRMIDICRIRRVNFLGEIERVGRCRNHIYEEVRVRMLERVSDIYGREWVCGREYVCGEE